MLWSWYCHINTAHPGKHWINWPNAATEMTHRQQCRSSICLASGRCHVFVWDDLVHVFVPDTSHGGHRTLHTITSICFMTFSSSANEIYMSLLPNHRIHAMTQQASLTFFSSERSHVLQSCIASIGQ